MQIKQENDGHAVIDQLTGEEVLTCAINIGEQLLMSGAEISRVEDTIRRICAAYDIRQSHIFSIASCIIVTLETKGFSAMFVGALIRITLYAFTAIKMKPIFSNILCSMISGMVCILTHYIGLGHHVEMIMIGNIMLLIPGVLMTNSFRDFISGDMISGLLHFSEAIITAICIAAGFIFSKILLGGIL